MISDYLLFCYCIHITEYNTKNEQSASECSNTYKPHKYNAKQKKQDTNRQNSFVLSEVIIMVTLDRS